MIKIAQVIGEARLGGVISFVMNYYRNIDRSKFEFDFFTYAPSVFDNEIKALGGKVFYIPKPKRPFFFMRVLKERFIEERYDIVHSHLTSLNGFVLKAAKRAKVAVRVSHAHSTSNRTDKWHIVKKMLLPSARKYATHFAACGQIAGRYLYGKRDFTVIHNAVDLKKFRFTGQQRIENREKLNIPKNSICFVGRLAFQKNYKFMLKAFGRLVKIRPDSFLMLVGGGDTEKVKKLIKRYGIESRVMLTGFCVNPAEYYSACGLFWLPSRFEGLPLVAIEAQAAGLPGVYSERITREIDICGNNVFLPIRDPGEWARRSALILDNPPEQDENALQRLYAQYDITAKAPELEQYYASLIQTL